jgi:hypothetical protein
MIALMLLASLLFGGALSVRRGEVLATSVRFQYANRTLSPWQHVRAGDCARFGVVGRSYVRVPSDALESATAEHSIKVQFQFTEARRRHVSSAWLALVAPQRVLSNATLQFVHSDRGLLLRVDIDAEYEYAAQPPRPPESGVWSVRHRWQQHESVNRYAGFLWLLGVTFLVTFFTVVYIFVSSWRAFSSGASLFSAPSKSSAPPGAAVATAASSSPPDSFDKDI